jgi:hypothetical protein
MYRRRFLATVGLTATAALAGCSSDQAPPPRKSKVLEQLKARNTVLRIDLADNPWVVSRYESTEDLRVPASLESRSHDLNPIGVAEAKGGGRGGGRGATGRASGGYSNKPTTHHGWVWWHGGDYADDWYEEHNNEVKKYGVTVAAIGVAYLGPTAEYRDDRPGAGPVAWNQKYENPDDVTEHPILGAGWHRVGTHIIGNNHDFRWEAVDFKVVSDGSGYAVENAWKISPRI